MISEPPPLDLLLSRRELSLARRQDALRRENGITFYEPHEKQYQFHIADYRFRHGRFGNQTGKSEMGSTEDISYSLGYRPFMERRFPIINGKREVIGWHEGYKGHPFSTIGIPDHPTKGLIITEDWDKSKEVFTELVGDNKGKLFTYIPADAIGEPTRNHSGAIDRIPIRHKNGGWSVIHIDTVKSFKQNQMALESSIWDWIHVDEPCPEKMFKAAARGLMARNGRAWLNLTPLTEPWIQDMFVPNMNQLLDDVGSVVNRDKIMLLASMYDNPYLTEEGRDAYISLLSDEEKECRVKGIPSAYSGIVYKEFSWHDHVIKETPPGWRDWATPPEDYTLRFAIDYHPRKPHHVLFIATSPHEVQYVYAEIFLSCLMSELVSEIKTVLKREATTPGLIDPLASTPNRVTDITPLEEVLRLDLPVMPATKDPHNGILKVKELLKTKNRLGKPILVVNPDCRRFLFEIARGFVWDKDTNKPVKDNDDAMENFYRLALQGLPYIEPATYGDYAPIPALDIPANVLDFPDLSDVLSDEDGNAAKKKRYASRYRA